MNRILFLLLIACCTFSCAGPAAQQDAVANDSLVLDSPSAEEPVQKDFKTLDTALSFAGLWVNETYIHNLRKTRSPRNSQGVMESCITIPPRTLQATRMVAGFHDGAGDMVVVKDQDSYKLYYPDLTNMAKELDIISSSRIRIGDQYFSRIAHRDTTLVDFGILEELLFSGRYELKPGRDVIFSVDGHVQGLDSFTRYTPQIDYTTGPMGEFDLVSMQARGPREADFGYRFAGDTLLIFRVTCATPGGEGMPCDSVTAGSNVYKLLRKKD
ncbi:MAG TPA: hypothetical protein VGD35_11265 [Chitinophaga sp.]